MNILTMATMGNILKPRYNVPGSMYKYAKHLHESVINVPTGA